MNKVIFCCGLCFEEAVNKYLDTVDKGVSSIKHIANQTLDRFNLHNFMLRLFSLHIHHSKSALGDIKRLEVP